MMAGLVEIFSEPNVDHFISTCEPSLLQLSPELTGIFVSFLDPLFEVRKGEREMSRVTRRRNSFRKRTSMDKLAHCCRTHVQLFCNGRETLSLLPESHDFHIPSKPTRPRRLGCCYFTTS